MTAVVPRGKGKSKCKKANPQDEDEDEIIDEDDDAGIEMARLKKNSSARSIVRYVKALS
jgi:hypothetical protein